MEKPNASNSNGMNVLTLLKGSERYVFFYDEASEHEVLLEIGKSAADPELSFSWYDAAMLSQQVRRLTKKTLKNDPPTQSEPPTGSKLD